MAAPIRKVRPSGLGIQGTVIGGTGTVTAGEAAASPGIHESLSAFGIVVSSTAPQSLHRAAMARAEIRRSLRLR